MAFLPNLRLLRWDRPTLLSIMCCRTAQPSRSSRRSPHIDTVNENPKPFRWNKSADKILACIKRFYLRTSELAPAQS